MRCHSRLRATTIALLAGVLLAACGTAGKGGSPGSEAGRRRLSLEEDPDDHERRRPAGRGGHGRHQHVPAGPGRAACAGKSWLKLDLAALSKVSGKDLGNLTQVAGNDPSQALALLKGASTDVREVG